MVQLVLRVIDIESQRGIASAEVTGKGQGHGGLIGNTYSISFVDYTDSSGYIHVDASYLDNYDVSIVVTATGYHSLTETFTTGGLTGNYNQTFSLTPSNKSAPPGQGAGAELTGFFNQISNQLAGQAGAMGTSFDIIFVAIAIIAIAVIVVVLRFG